MKKIFVAVLALIVLIPVLSFAVGFSNKTVSGVFEQVAVQAETVTATPNEVDTGMMFYFTPYDLPATLDIVVTYGPNTYTATGTYKITADADNVDREFGPYYANPFDSNVNWYLSLTTSAEPAASCTVYTRSYQPTKHNY